MASLVAVVATGHAAMGVSLPSAKLSGLPHVPASEQAMPAGMTGDLGERSTDSDEHDGDLGIQPVLLLDRVMKSAPRISPPVTAVPLAGVLGPSVPLNTMPFRRSGHAQDVPTRQVRPHAGIALMPHGPPSGI